MRDTLKIALEKGKNVLIMGVVVNALKIPLIRTMVEKACLSEMKRVLERLSAVPRDDIRRELERLRVEPPDDLRRVVERLRLHPDKTESQGALLVLTILKIARSNAFHPTPKGFLIDLLLPPDRADDVLFNLLGRYDYWVDKHGRTRADIIFFTQSIGCILSFWTDWVLKRLKLIDLFR
jgi:hypothetical protein